MSGGQLVLLVTLLGLANAYEIVPHASALRKPADIRRAPTSDNNMRSRTFAPLAKSLKPVSTGVRRAPPPPPTKVAYRHPMPQFVPQYIPFPVLQPQPLPTLPPMPPMPTLATITPMPGLPTLPGLTMPPSFQRLLGITTTTPLPLMEPVVEKPIKKPAQYSSPTYNKDLNTVRSRLSKYVRGADSNMVKPESDADWIVPF